MDIYRKICGPYILCFHWQREHFKLDWHKFNLKQKLMDKPVLSEDAFEETISGTITILCDDYQNGQTRPCELCWYSGCALLWLTPWTMVPNFYTWATRKSFFGNKSFAGYPRFFRFRVLGSLQFFLQHSLDCTL